MKIKCPDCSTSYDIKPAALGAEGRSVKCARCGTRWFVPPAEQDEEELQIIEDEAEWKEDAAQEERTQKEPEQEQEPDDWEENAQSEIVEDKPSKPSNASDLESPDQVPPGPDTTEDTEDVKKPLDIETSAKRPKININPDKFKQDYIAKLIKWVLRQNYGRLSGIGVLLAALLLCALLVTFRESIVRAAPDLAKLYSLIGMDVNLRGLEFQDLRTFHEIEDGKPVLVVEGTITNIKPEANVVPAIRFSLRGADLQEIYAWTAEPKTKLLKGLDKTRFRTVLSEPPVGILNIQARFIDRVQRPDALR